MPTGKLSQNTLCNLSESHPETLGLIRKLTWKENYIDSINQNLQDLMQQLWYEIVRSIKEHLALEYYVVYCTAAQQD